MERALDVDVPESIEIFLAHLLGRHVLCQHTSAGRQQTDRTELGDDPVCRGIDVRLRRDVAAHSERPASVRLHESNRIGATFGVEVDAGDVGTLLGERCCCGLTKTLGRAGDDGDFAGERERDREILRGHDVSPEGSSRSSLTRPE